MNKIIFASLLLLLSNCVFSQYEIQYDYFIKNFGTESSSGIVLKTYLYTDGINSKFVKNRVINGSTENKVLNSDEELLELIRSRLKPTEGDSIGQLVIKNNYNDSISLRVQNTSKKYIRILELNKLEIESLDDYKIIENFNCQKAIIKNEYRTFEVWFTSEIDINDGPWKLNGVPGLILHAISVDKTHEFKVTSIKKTAPFDRDFFNYPFYEEIEKEDYVKDYIESNEKEFKYRKSKAEDGSNLKLTLNNLEIPLTNFE